MSAATRNEIEDHPSLEAAVQSLKDRGFVKASHVSEHYAQREAAADGYYQRADAFVPHNMNIGRISFWSAIA